jgi:hypothetical protein
MKSNPDTSPLFTAVYGGDVECDGKSKECVKVISIDRISWELSVGGVISIFMSVSYADQQSRASSNCDNSGLMLLRNR